MQRVFKQIAWVANSHVPVLITGESGTGKELAARAIHRHSARSEAPYLPVSLAALSESVIESELFGHVKGAFTGATQDRLGLLELAAEGTMFLDEIGDTTLSLQVKLLRALEQREVMPVGDARPRPIAARILAATNRPLRDMIERGEFREDLYLSLKRVRDPFAPASGPPGGHPRLGRAVRDFGLPRNADACDFRGSTGGIKSAGLAGQRPRAAKRHRARGDRLAGRNDSRRSSSTPFAPCSRTEARLCPITAGADSRLDGEER